MRRRRRGRQLCRRRGRGGHNRRGRRHCWARRRRGKALGGNCELLVEGARLLELLDSLEVKALPLENLGAVCELEFRVQGAGYEI